MTSSAKSDLENTLKSLDIPEIGLSLGDVAGIRDCQVSDKSVVAVVELGFPAASLVPALEEKLRAAMTTVAGEREVKCEITTRIRAHGVQRNLKPLDNVSNIIAVASGKGGVGKSTTAANLGLALSAEGAKVGILDADIYGPSIPLMMGVAGERPTSDDGESMNPLTAHGLQVMSIGFLIDADQPMVWRGPMVTQALNQMLQQTRWSELDYLIVDMPPGTGDIQLTLSQQVPVSGAVIVTTPQDIALLDARKGLQMFRKVSIPVLGVIENMSRHICSACGHEEALFGSGGGQRMATEYEVALLGQLPLDLAIREQTDGGSPSVVTDPDGGPARAYRSAAWNTAARLATLGKDYSRRFPKIVVEET